MYYNFNVLFTAIINVIYKYLGIGDWGLGIAQSPIPY